MIWPRLSKSIVTGLHNGITIITNGPWGPEVFGIICKKSQI